MEILRNNLKNETNIRTQLDFPIKGMEFIDVTPLLINPVVFTEIVSRFVDEIKDLNVDYIIAPEARGFLFAPSIAYLLNAGCIPVRKKGKLPTDFVEAEASYEKEYGPDIVELPVLVNGNYSGKRYYIVDDIYASGNTIKAIKEAIELLGGEVVGYGAIINLVGLNTDTDVFSLIDAKESVPTLDKDDTSYSRTLQP